MGEGRNAEVLARPRRKMGRPITRQGTEEDGVLPVEEKVFYGTRCTEMH